jgi:hypothetical protein
MPALGRARVPRASQPLNTRVCGCAGRWVARVGREPRRMTRRRGRRMRCAESLAPVKTQDACRVCAQLAFRCSRGLRGLTDWCALAGPRLGTPAAVWCRYGPGPLYTGLKQELKPLRCPLSSSSKVGWDELTWEEGAWRWDVLLGSGRCGCAGLPSGSRVDSRLASLSPACAYWDHVRAGCRYRCRTGFLALCLISSTAQAGPTDPERLCRA